MLMWELVERFLAQAEECAHLNNCGLCRLRQTLNTMSSGTDPNAVPSPMRCLPVASGN